ncbi:hypothetical protein CgunFtcFv8_027904 [Champsocephalus gunnari]|uniref:Uncharacterized protein n=1 Tax=Champsocephalus gunnari TaxID=52237 RepID=A0AAN8EBY9_CHAGU|nr:hypothetical protein CgunFtcFv8_027904 [Champsocephalus gunnari]
MTAGLTVRVATSPLTWRVNQRCPGDADRLDQRVRDRTGLLTAVNSGKDMPERHDIFSFSQGQEEHPRGTLKADVMRF